jgi:hypothetical protein
MDFFFAFLGMDSPKFQIFGSAILPPPSSLGAENGSCQAPVAHTCNPSYSGDRDQEDQGFEASLSK